MKQLGIFTQHTLDCHAVIIFDDKESLSESELVSIYKNALLKHAKLKEKWKPIYTPAFRFLKLNERVGCWESYGSWYDMNGNKIEI